MRDLPIGVNNIEKYNSSYGRIVILGLLHNECHPTEVVDLIQSLDINPSAICVEAPKGLIDAPDHNVAKQYKNQHGAEIITIDQRFANREGGNEYLDKKQDEGYSKDLTGVELEDDDEQLEEEIGKTAKNSPEWSEVNREREQMMANEILTRQKLGHNNIVAIVGTSHTKEIKHNLSTMENKYDY